jgi:hypothetical protein
MVDRHNIFLSAPPSGDRFSARDLFESRTCPVRGGISFPSTLRALKGGSRRWSPFSRDFNRRCRVTALISDEILYRAVENYARDIADRKRGVAALINAQA